MAFDFKKENEDDIFEVRESDIKYRIRLDERLFNFAVNVIKILKTMKRSIETDIVRYQLTKSVNSAGANYEEAQAASSRANFKNKVDISLKEMLETNYWLRILIATKMVDSVYIKPLVDESEQLKKILGSIAFKVSTKVNGKR